jgi:hypothetical protein
LLGLEFKVRGEVVRVRVRVRGLGPGGEGESIMVRMEGKDEVRVKVRMREGFFCMSLSVSDFCLLIAPEPECLSPGIVQS